MTERNAELRSYLIGIVSRILKCDGSEEEMDELIATFESLISHPAGTDLIFYPKSSPDPSAEQIVDEALSYVPPQLQR